MQYLANEGRYTKMEYRRCGNSGLKLPAISLGLWHNFGHIDVTENARNILRVAFDNGITHFDLANNYGPPAGSAEENFGRIFKDDFTSYRDELIISTKAGWGMWPGPYGDWGQKNISLPALIKV
jgi:L-glyceraldehyde 3-phosphate reductase